MNKPGEHNEILSRYVKRIWSVDCREYSTVDHQLKFFADGCPGIMFQEGEAPMMINSDRKLASVFLYGQTVLPIVLSTSGNYRAMVVFLQPDALEHLFGIYANELTDTCVDLDLIKQGRDFRITERLLNAGSDSGRVEVMENFLLALITKRNSQPKLEVRQAIQLINESNGKIRIEEISEELQISKRTLVRQFEQFVGVSPKTFSSICQFQFAIQRLGTGKYQSLSDVAYDSGYADQSHFIRWFKTYTGETPLDFVKSNKSLPKG